MAISIVQSVITDCGATTSPHTSWPSSTTAGNFLLAMLLCVDSSSNSPVTGPSGYTYAQGIIGGTSPQGINIYYQDNAASQSGDQYFATPIAGQAIMVLAEIAGLTVGVTIDASGANSNATLHAQDTIVTNYNGDLVVAFIGFNGIYASSTAQGSPDDGFTMDQELHIGFSGVFSQDAAFLWKEVATPSTCTPGTTVTTLTSHTWAMCEVAFKTGSGGSPSRRRAHSTFL